MLKYKSVENFPRLPLEGSIDLTYRCNNDCLHCWVFKPDTDEVRSSELTTEEWQDIIRQARAMGTRDWGISGGEPLLRDDFEVLFNQIAAQSSFITVNTNATLITPAIARCLKKSGIVLVSLYGADAAVHDRVTRNAGSFDAALRGISYLGEAGARFQIQLVPMNENIRQWEEMKALAGRLSPRWRLGAPFLHLAASGDAAKNEQIRGQRLPFARLVELDPPHIPADDDTQGESSRARAEQPHTYRHCIDEKRSFHIDPGGGLSFCCLIKEGRLRYDLRKGSFREGWESFIPSLAMAEENHHIFGEACRTCGLKDECQTCPGLGFLENKGLKEPSPYLCSLAKGKDAYRRVWKSGHRRFFQIAGISIEFNSERAIEENTFSPALRAFEVDRPGTDRLSLEHFFTLPDVNEESLGKKVHGDAPWLIYQKGDSWTYAGFVDVENSRRIFQMGFFSGSYSSGRIYSDSDRRYRDGNLNSLALFPTDQIWLAHVLLRRQAFFVHSCGLVVDGNGLIFIGHSRAGKSTMAKLFGARAELLCDDRNILRKWPQGWRVHGTWSHGELSSVSPSSAPLSGLFFLEKSTHNELVRIQDPREVKKRLLPCLARPLAGPDWWEKIWILASDLAGNIPAYILRFNLSGSIVQTLIKLNSERRLANAIPALQEVTNG